MWLDHIQHYVRSALQRTVRWPRLEDVYSEQRYRTVIREIIDRHVAELRAKNRADATPIDSETPGVGPLTHLQVIGAEPEARRRDLDRTWLSTQDRSFLRRAFLHAMDIVAPEPLGLAALLDSILRAEITGRPLESAPETPNDELAARLAEFRWSLHYDPAVYAEEVRLVVDGVGTELGRAFVRLSGRAAVVFLLVVESLQSAGPPDEWRVGVPTLEYLLARPVTHWDPDEPDHEFSHTLLKVKLDLVRELVRARERGQPEGEAKIQALWTELRAGDAHAKGRRLEELLLRIFTSVPGFKETGHRVRTHTEELDIVIRNEAADPFWQKLSSYLLVECKNWSKRVGTPEMAWFADKVRERPGSLGFFAAPEGFSEAVDEKLRSYRKEGLHVRTLDRVDLDSLVRTPDRNELLKTIHARSVTG